MSYSIVLGALLVSFAVVFGAPATGDEKPVPTLPGTCPDYKPIASMEGLKLDGEWHGVYYAKHGIEKKGTIKCVKKSVTIKPDGKIDSVLSAIKDGQPKSKTIHAAPISGQSGKFTLTKDTTDASEASMTKTGTLLAADDKFLVEVICGTSTDGTKHAIMVAVYSRQPTLDAASLEKAKTAVTAAGIDVELKPVEGC